MPARAGTPRRGPDLGQGAFKAGWQAHQLSQPGAFLISDPEHTVPERHRAYLIDDAQIARHAAQHAHGRPGLGPSGRRAPDGPRIAADGRRPPGPWSMTTMSRERRCGPRCANAGPDGVGVAALLALTGMTRRRRYYRHLRAHADAGRAVQVSRGYWRAAGPSDGTSGDGQPPGRRPAPVARTASPPGREPAARP